MAQAIGAANDNVPLLQASDAVKLEQGNLITTVLTSPPGVEVQAIMRCSPERIFRMLTDYANMPAHISFLERADVMRLEGETAAVRFEMKLPFPVGRVSWSNQIQTRQVGSLRSIEWTLLDGDLEVNEGKLILNPYRGESDKTYARYQVRVQSRTALPKSAERLATRWLLPKIVAKLRRVAENK